MTQLEGLPTRLAGATVGDLEERLEHLKRTRDKLAGERRRIVEGAIRRTREELRRRGVTPA